MRSRWVAKTLGDLIDIKHGFAFKGEHFRDEPPGDILLTPGNFTVGGGFKKDKLKYYEGPVPDEYVLHGGELIVTMTDLSKSADTLGYPAFVPLSSGRPRYLHNQRLGKIIAKDSEVVDLRYLYYLMCSKGYRHEVIASATGTTVKHTSPERIKRFSFLLPPLSEQKAIAHMLGTLDDKIELNRRMNETLEGVARAIYRSWFVDFDPVRAKIEGRWRRGQSLTGLPANFFEFFPGSLEEADIGEIPSGWEVRGLDEIGRFLNGLALQNYPPKENGSLPVIKIAQLRSGNTMGADTASMDIESDYVVDDGDVLFSWSGSLECAFWTGGRGALNQHLFKVTSDKFPKWFYYFWIHHHLPSFRHIAAGKATTMGHIQRHHLSDSKVVVATGALMKAADIMLSPIIERVIAIRKESRGIATLRDTLLPKLVSGEIRVTN